jgi:hypothetical protein
MDSPTIRRLRIEWQALGTAAASSSACHRLAELEPVVERLKLQNLAELVDALSLSSIRLWHRPVSRTHLLETTR